MSSFFRFAAVAGISAFIAGCASDPTVNREAKVELSPMEKPAKVLGQARWLDKGEPMTQESASLGSGQFSGAWLDGRAKGCSWVNDGWFAPTSSWENCGGSTGTQQMTKSGDIWPLAVGKIESYKVKGQNNKNNNWTTTRNCEVKAAVLVSVQDKQIPSYEVVCKDSWTTQKWYVSPELNRVVKYNRRHKDRGLVADRVLLIE